MFLVLKFHGSMQFTFENRVPREVVIMLTQRPFVMASSGYVSKVFNFLFVNGCVLQRNLSNNQHRVVLIGHYIYLKCLNT